MANKIYVGAPTAVQVRNLLDYNAVQSGGYYFGYYKKNGETGISYSQRDSSYDISQDAGWTAPAYERYAIWYDGNALAGRSYAPYILARSSGFVSVALNHTHKYYISLMVYFDRAVSGFNVYWPIAEPAVFANHRIAQAGRWTKVSKIFTREGFSDRNYEIRVDWMTPTANNHLRVANLILVDLTDVFGAGSEPSQEWCDANLPFHATISTNASETQYVTAEKQVARYVYRAYVGALPPVTVTNLLSNGSFENYVQGNNQWQRSSAKAKFGSYSLLSKPAANYVETFIRPASPYMTQGHIYYASVWVLQNTTLEQSLDLYWPEAEPVMLSWATNTELGVWQHHSIVINRSAWATGYYQIRIDCNNAKANAEMYVDGLMLVDLTDAFGAGNEPNKAWCDANIPFTTGSVLVPGVTGTPKARRVVKGYIGVNGVARQFF